MADDLSVAVERLRTSTQRLNTICDGAGQLIRDAEAFLEECQVGVETWVEVRRVDVTGDGHYDLTGLGYLRLGGKFRIAVVNEPHFSSGPEDCHVKAWAESSRDDKLDTLEKLPELLVELAKQVDARTVKAEQAMATVNSLLSLPKKRKGGE